ncbi:MAG: metal ABC transporter permease [Phycisphaerales bacterium]|nr:metal ABC transporter permease [Phycisphaerales bacterium]
MGAWALQIATLAPVRVDWPGWTQVLQTLTFRAGFNSAGVVLAATVLGIAGGTVGTFALLRQRALMSDALAHATLPGIGAAYLIAVALGATGKSLPGLLAGATVTGIIGVLTVHAITRHTRLKEDAAIAAVLSVFFGAGVVLLSYIQRLPTGTQGGLNHFIYGQPAAMSLRDAALIGGAAHGAIAVAAVLLKELRAVCFDDRFAAAIGLRVFAIDLVVMGLVVLVTVIGLQAVGLMLVVSLLVVPPATARFWTDNLTRMTILSGVIGGLSGYIGASASAVLQDLPAGAVIVLTGGTFFVVSMLISPRRGVIHHAVRLATQRAAVARDHFLRGAYEVLEIRGVKPGDEAGGGFTLHEIKPGRTIGLGTRVLAAWLVRRGLLERGSAAGAAKNWALTARGHSEALRLTRNHRLWEEYLVTHAEVAPSHVDRSADRVEHALSATLVRELEEALRQQGRLPMEFATAPASVHPMGGARARAHLDAAGGGSA